MRYRGGGRVCCCTGVRGCNWVGAVEAGGEVLLPVSEMFWGDRYGQLRDPFGIKWSIATPIRKS